MNCGITHHEGCSCHEQRHADEIARLTAHAALAREESRGAHFRTDFPEPDPSQAHRTCWAADTPTALPSIDLTEVA